MITDGQYKAAMTALKEIRAYSRELSPGKARQISNRCDKVSVLIKKLIK